MRKWKMPVYLDAGSHVNLDGKPCYYCGVFNLYKLEHTMRSGLASLKDLEPAQERFLAARKKLLEEGGGVVSIVYHPCEFVHKQFWDGANFRKGSNPPREEWKLPAAKTAEESRVAYQVLENYVRFMKRFPEVRFITASEAGKLYRDRAQNFLFGRDHLKAIASAVTGEVTFQRHGRRALAASEVFQILEPMTTTWSQLKRTAIDVGHYLRKHERVPAAVWLGSQSVPPEAYLNTLAQVLLTLLDGKEPPPTTEVKPAKLEAAKYVSADDPKLWGWVIFPPGFRAPALMELARLQAWTIKPALLSGE
jgi:hypothetical protein